MRTPYRGGCFSELLLMVVAALALGLLGTGAAWLADHVTRNLFAR